MSLLNPVAESNSRHIDSENIKRFASSEQIDPVTKLALDCFSDIQDRRLGRGHYVKKGLVTGLTFLTALSLPVGGAGYGLWNYVPRTVESAAAISGTFLTLLVVNSATKRIMDVSPIKAVVTLFGGAVFYGAVKITECCASSFTKQEAEANEFIGRSYVTMKESLNKTYEGMAGILLADFEEAKKNPKELFAIKDRAEKIRSRFEATCMRLAELGFSPSEVTAATNALQEAARAVVDYRITMYNDPLQNIKLLVGVPEARFTEYCIPELVLQRLQEAKALELGLLYQLRKYVVLTLGTLAPTAAGGGIAHFAELGYEVPTVAGAVVVSLIAARLIYSAHKSHEVETKERQNSLQQAAKDELIDTYDAMAKICTRKPSKTKRKRTVEPHLKEALKLKPRLEQIEERVAALRIPGFTSNQVTGKLNSNLQLLG